MIKTRYFGKGIKRKDRLSTVFEEICEDGTHINQLLKVSLERFELSPSASEAGTLSIALQGRRPYFTMFKGV